MRFCPAVSDLELAIERASHLEMLAGLDDGLTQGLPYEFRLVLIGLYLDLVVNI